MWTTVLLLLCCECAYLIRDSIFDFLKHDYTTSINTIYEHQSEFPTISFCSYPQPFNESIHKYIVFCRFIGDTSCTYKPEIFFEMFKDGRYGICFRFNSGENIFNKSIAILKILLVVSYFDLHWSWKWFPTANLFPLNKTFIDIIKKSGRTYSHKECIEIC